MILVTDRGYQSLINIQKQIDLEVKFIQGIRLSEDIVKRSFDRYDASLHNQRFYDTAERVYAHSATEAWNHKEKPQAAAGRTEFGWQTKRKRLVFLPD